MNTDGEIHHRKFAMLLCVAALSGAAALGHQTVGVLGTATGSTLAGTALHPDVEHIEGIEISRDTYRLARAHFTPFNRDVFSDLRVDMIIEDARWVVANRRSYYDVVVGDVFMPWKTGTGRIYTREHFRSVKQSLKPGGIYCQWFAMFQLSESQFWTILSTFQDVFPETVLISVDFFRSPISAVLCRTRLGNGAGVERGRPGGDENDSRDHCETAGSFSVGFRGRMVDMAVGQPPGTGIYL